MAKGDREFQGLFRHCANKAASIDCRARYTGNADPLPDPRKKLSKGQQSKSTIDHNSGQNHNHKKTDH